MENGRNIVVNQAANREINPDYNSLKQYSFHMISTFQTSIIPSQDLIFDVEVIDELNDIKIKEQFKVKNIDVDFESILISVNSETFMNLGKNMQSFNAENNPNLLSDIGNLLVNKETFNFKITDIDKILDGNPLI